MNLEVDRFLEDLEGRYAGHFRDAIGGLVVAMARGNRFAILDATTVLRSLIGETMGVGEILGARLVLRHAAEAADGAPVMFRDGTQPLLPSVTFSESVDDMVKRAPVTLRGAAQRTARRISEIYSRGGMVAFARSAEQTVTAKVQEVIVQAMREGLGEGAAGQLIRESVDLIRERTDPWTSAYARTVFRNNVNTAVTAGRFRQAMDPDIRAVIPCFRFDAVGDADTRHNHEAANGLIFKTTNPVWQRIAPPLGHNCILPWTRICGIVEAASKAVYSGPAVEIQTSNGGRLAVTINHPILTISGWKPAGLLAEGDQLVSDDVSIETLSHGAWDWHLPSVSVGGRAEHDGNIPACAQDAFDDLAADAAGTSRSFRDGVLPLDLHGDAVFVQGEIDVVLADGVLPANLDASVGQGQGQFGLKLGDHSAHPSGHSNGSLGDRLGRPFASPGSPPCGGALTLDLCGVGPHPDPLHLFGCGAIAHSHVLTGEVSGEGASADSKLAGKLLDAHAGQVSIDHVVNVRHFDWSGHVYDFRTRNGMIVAGGIVTSNCRCQVSLVTLPELRRMGRVSASGEIQEDTLPPGAFPDEGFRHTGRMDLFGVGA